MDSRLLIGLKLDERFAGDFGRYGYSHLGITPGKFFPEIGDSEALANHKEAVAARAVGGDTFVGTPGHLPHGVAGSGVLVADRALEAPTLWLSVDGLHFNHLA
jgi:hypothetical protein